MTSVRSQVEIEARLERGWQAFRGGEATVGEAFGEHESWETELEGHRVRLDPLLRRWLWLNGADRWWDDSGVGPGEAVLLPLGGLLGARRLPSGSSQATVIEEWWVMRRGLTIIGPLPSLEARGVLGSGDIGPDALVWRTTDVRWRPAVEVARDVEPPAARFCVRCGAPTMDGARYCAGCGAPLHGSTSR